MPTSPQVTWSATPNCEIQLNKKEYVAGETIDVAIRAPYVGAGLITIERDKVYTQQLVPLTTTSSVQHIRLRASRRERLRQR